MSTMEYLKSQCRKQKRFNAVKNETPHPPPGTVVEPPLQPGPMQNPQAQPTNRIHPYIVCNSRLRPPPGLRQGRRLHLNVVEQPEIVSPAAGPEKKEEEPEKKEEEPEKKDEEPENERCPVGKIIDYDQ